MAKDRANDPKRIPNLGISDPISHVRTMGSGPNPLFYNQKFDSNFDTDEERIRHANMYEEQIGKSNAYFAKKGKTNVIKIDSSK